MPLYTDRNGSSNPEKKNKKNACQLNANPAASFHSVKGLYSLSHFNHYYGMNTSFAV
jgi:hypothetical protein